MAESRQLLKLQQDFMHYVLGESSEIVPQIESTPALSAIGRLDIYATAYKLRLKEAITTDYEVLHTYLGDEQFDSVMETYIKHYPSHITNLRYYSIDMTALLKTQAPFNQHPVLAELATIESSFANSFDSKDQSIITLNELATIAAEAWATLQLNFQPSVQILPMAFNSFAIWRAISNDDAPPALETASENLNWVLWRRADLISHYRPLDVAEHVALNLALQGENFAVICEALLDFFSEEETPMKAVSYLQSWVTEEMLSSLDF
jgi:hypothetical protein